METQKPYMFMILIQFIAAGNGFLSKAALSGGMSSLVFAFYRVGVATLFLAPFAVIMERKVAPPLCFKTHLKIFLLALFGITSTLVLFVIALDYTSATLSAAITNGLPVVTFVTSLLFRREIVNLRSFSGRIKIVGVAVCAAGVAILALYKGPTLKFLDQQHPIYKETDNSVHADGGTSKKWILGSLLMFLTNVTWAIYLNLQATALENYPSRLLLTVFQCFYSSIQIGVIAVAFERNLSKWKLGLDIQLISVIYCGVFVTGVTFWIQAWCIQKKGPVFIALFMPLCLLITICLSGLLLGEHTTVGSVLGGVMMVIGLYSVLWGKSKEGTNSKDVEGGREEQGTCEEFETIDEHEKECLEVKVTI